MDDFTWTEVGQRIRDWRIAAGLSQRALADMVGLSQPSIQAIETGACNPQLNSLERLASALRKSTRELIGGEPLASDPRVQRLQRILGSGHQLAIAAAEQGLACAEALLETQPNVRRTLGKSGRSFRRVLGKEDAERANELLRPPTGQSLRRRVAGDDLTPTLEGDPYGLIDDKQNPPIPHAIISDGHDNPKERNDAINFGNRP
jgi:transcriptional regulator with XRE-family HTH domain